jgi:hypothetical protein
MRQVASDLRGVALRAGGPGIASGTLRAARESGGERAGGVFGGMKSHPNGRRDSNGRRPSRKPTSQASGAVAVVMRFALSEVKNETPNDRPGSPRISLDRKMQRKPRGVIFPRTNCVCRLAPRWHIGGARSARGTGHRFERGRKRDRRRRNHEKQAFPGVIFATAPSCACRQRTSTRLPSGRSRR